MANTVKEERPLTCLDTACETRVATARGRGRCEMIEGCPPFSYKQDNEVPKAYVSKQRPPFRAPPKQYAHGLKE
ncbi:hypothetical protein BHM03_00021818 [Ensete ventricosum]|nr:hypothetical protein BHM03_00021818 [Ensete ventricosum]